MALNLLIVLLALVNPSLLLLNLKLHFIYFHLVFSDLLIESSLLERYVIFSYRLIIGYLLNSSFTGFVA